MRSILVEFWTCASSSWLRGLSADAHESVEHVYHTPALGPTLTPFWPLPMVALKLPLNVEVQLLPIMIEPLAIAFRQESSMNASIVPPAVPRHGSRKATPTGFHC